MGSIIIGLAGPSGAGKTTLVRHIAESYPHITHVRLDGFYKDFETFPQFGDYVNREAPENIKWDEFYSALNSLKNGTPTEFPLYEKKTGIQCGTETLSPTPVIFVEGFLLYHDERIRNLIDIKTYLDVSVEEQYRRKKGRWPEMDDRYFYEVVVPMFEQYGKPGSTYAHAIINGDNPVSNVIQDFTTSPHVEPLLQMK